MKLTNKLIRDALLFLFILSIPAYFFAYNYSLKQSEVDREQGLMKHLQSFRGTLSEALWNGDYPYSKQIVNTLSYGDGVELINLFDEKMELVPQVTPVTTARIKLLNKWRLENFQLLKNLSFVPDTEKVRKSLVLPLSKIVQEKEERVGFIQVVYRMDDLREKARLAALLMIGIVLTIFLAFFLFEFLYLRKLIIKPLSDLEQAISRMNSSGDIRLPVQENHIFEIASLTTTFNKMGEDLQNSANIISSQQVQMINISKMSSLGEMAAGVAHEINNPLMITKGFLERIQKIISTDSEKFSEIKAPTEKAISGVHRVAKIVSGLRSFARNASNDPMVSVPLEKILSETLELCFERFKHGEVRLETPKGVLSHILCRESQISQVLLNLLNNAFDAVTELEIKDKWVKLEVSEKESSNKVVIRIIDCGYGIPDEVAKRILEPFFTTKETGKGTGLGLSISVGIVEEHNGHLTLDPYHPNTCFVIELPRSS